ncbi:TIM-barrel domain-containing protein [Lacticaseibacillus jixianensis]|uniref:TIM-barrel domain-containing protein n=1 Tax=Lacticaseibacillus jixianensis TaxID=2486012 RepID=A0ABW4BAY9_9LACO|nr:TIM-barrel domain-containing protein [Lacticaseibacillus jixianensis]
MENINLTPAAVSFDHAGHHYELTAVNDHLVHLLAYAGERPAHPTVASQLKLAKHADETVATGGTGQRYDAPLVINQGRRDFDEVRAPLALQLGQYRLVLAAATERLRAVGSAEPFTLALPTFDAAGWTQVVRTASDAAFFGGGTQNGIVALTDRIIKIANENVWTQGGVTSPVPFFWSTAGFGLLANTFTPGEYDFSNLHHGVRIHHADPVFDVYLILGATPQALIHGYHELTGAPNLLPWASYYPTHLNAYNRDYWVKVTADSAGSVEMLPGQFYKEYQPIAKESFNTAKRPGTITVQGQQLVPNVYGSGRVTFLAAGPDGMPKQAIHESLNGEHDPAFSARTAVLRYQQAGMPLGTIYPNDGYGAGYGQTASFDGDLANLAAFVRWAKQQGVRTGLWTQKGLTPANPARPRKGERDFARELAAGVLAAKTDVAWVGEGYTFGLNATERVGALMRQRGLRPDLLTVDGWAGTQRSATVWSGDQAGSHWANLRAHIGTYLSTGLSGNPNVTADVDGIYAGTDPVIYVRDLEWKTFTASFLAMDGWGERPKQLGLQFGQPYADLCRAFVRYHVALIPYLYTLAHQAQVSGAPLVRPTFWQEQSPYTLGRALDDQFALGDAFLVAPIMDAYRLQPDGSDWRPSLYLPAGQWFDFWTNAQLTGGRTYADVKTPLAQLPVFVKAGSIIVLQQPALTPQAEKPDRVIAYYPGQNGQLTWYQDDGASLSYQQGAYATRVIAGQTRGREITVTIHPQRGAYAGSEQPQPLALFVPLTEAPVEVAAAVLGKGRPVQVTVGPRLGDPLAAARTQTGVTVALGDCRTLTEPLTVVIRLKEPLAEG